LNYYLSRILSPIISLVDKQWSEINHLDRMYLKSPNDMQHLVYSTWFILRTLKRDEQIARHFQQTHLRKQEDQRYMESLRSTVRLPVPKKRKKKSLVKTGTDSAKFRAMPHVDPLSTLVSKTKLAPSTMMADPPPESTPEQVLSLVVQRQLSTSRASKFFGGMKLDYLKYCLTFKTDSSLMTGSHLVQLNTFMQSQATVDWLRHLRSSYFWPCAKQIFLREVYQLTGVSTRNRSMNICGNGNLSSIRSCDLQSPGTFWRAFEDLHRVPFDNESVIDHDQWHDDFHQYLINNDLGDDKVSGVTTRSSEDEGQESPFTFLDTTVDCGRARISPDQKIIGASTARMERTTTHELDAESVGDLRVLQHWPIDRTEIRPPNFSPRSCNHH
jgi:hypothetical protein